MVATLLALSLARNIHVLGLNGKSVQILPSQAKRGVVAFFVMTGCPIANGYVPEMNRLAKEFKPKGWQFNVVYVDTLVSKNSLLSHYRDYGYTFPGVHDANRELVGAAKATKTPEAAVFSPDGTLLYDGRIDDRYYALGKQRAKARVHDLRDALKAIGAGKPVARLRTEVVGCFMPVD